MNIYICVVNLFIFNDEQLDICMKKTQAEHAFFSFIPFRLYRNRILKVVNGFVCQATLKWCRSEFSNW